MGRPEYDQLVRRVRWGEWPIYFLGSGGGFPVAHFAAHAVESLLEGPCIVRTPADFTAGAGVIRPRTVAMLISSGQESPDLLEAAKVLRTRNGTVLALVSKPDEPLAQAAAVAFLVHTGEESGAICSPICQQAALGCIALLAAKALKRPRPQFLSLEDEMAKLPEHLEWALVQLTKGVRALAAELGRAKSLTLLAGGSYHSTAMLAASHLRKLAGIRAAAQNAAEMALPQGAAFGRDETLLVLSGSRCRVKKQVHAMVETAKRAGTCIFSLTDGNDPEVTRRSALSLLLPPLHEVTGATLAHAIMAWTAYHAGRPESRQP
jgi:DNA-binding MurR/RpiR family transcriptional regulator